MKQFTAEWQEADAQDLTSVHTAVIKTVGHIITQHNAMCDHLEGANAPQEIGMPETITLPKPSWYEGLHNFREEGYVLALSDASKALGVEIKLED